MKTRSSTLMRASRAAIAALALAAIAACADEERAVPFVETDAGPDVVTKPPPSGDAGAAPPDADAGPPEYDAAVQTVVCAQAARQPCVTDLVAGENHFCALLDGGTVQCWGANARGALGFSDDEHVPGPSAVKDLTGATQLSSDGLVTCALLGNGEAACWGSNEHGQLARTDGDGGSVVDTLPHSSRETIPLPSKLARIDVGRRTVSGLTAAGDLYVWGRNDKGALARPDAGTSAMVAGPALADRGGFAIKQVASSDESLYGLTADAGLVNWGTVSGRESSLTPTAAMVPLSSADVTALTAGPAHACAIAGGRVACWGQNAYGVLGTGYSMATKLPTPAALALTGNTWPLGIAASARATCVHTTTGSVYCAGASESTRGEANAFAPSFVHVKAFGGHAVRVGTTTHAVCALDKSGEVFCWGANLFGELGQGSRDAALHPVPMKVNFQ